MVWAGGTRTGFRRETDYEMAPLTPPFPIALRRRQHTVPGGPIPARIACPGGLGQGSWFKVKNILKNRAAPISIGA